MLCCVNNLLAVASFLPYRRDSDIKLTHLTLHEKANITHTLNGEQHPTVIWQQLWEQLRLSPDQSSIAGKRSRLENWMLTLQMPRSRISVQGKQIRHTDSNCPSFGGTQSDKHPKGKLSLHGEQTHSSGMICWQPFWNNFTSVYSLQWWRGLGSVRGGWIMMERKSGTGSRLGSNPKWGKPSQTGCLFPPVMTAELLLSKGRRQAARLVSSSDLDVCCVRLMWVKSRHQIPCLNSFSLNTRLSLLLLLSAWAELSSPPVQIKEQSPL